MSYDIWLTIDTGGPSPAEVGRSWNFTSNCVPMWRAAGADLAEFAGKTAGQCIPTLADAIAQMTRDPATYKAMDAPNGWGTYDTLMPALGRLLDDFKSHPLATVHVSR